VPAKPNRRTIWLSGKARARRGGVLRCGGRPWCRGAHAPRGGRVTTSTTRGRSYAIPTGTTLRPSATGRVGTTVTSTSRDQSSHTIPGSIGDRRYDSSTAAAGTLRRTSAARRLRRSRRSTHRRRGVPASLSQGASFSSMRCRYDGALQDPLDVDGHRRALLGLVQTPHVVPSDRVRTPRSSGRGTRATLARVEHHGPRPTARN